MLKLSIIIFLTDIFWLSSQLSEHAFNQAEGAKPTLACDAWTKVHYNFSLFSIQAGFEMYRDSEDVVITEDYLIAGVLREKIQG